MISCIAIDDEFLALEVIENYIGRLPHTQLLKTFTNALEAIPFLNKEQPDLIFLDIDMPEIHGVEFLRSLRKPPLAIFTTAYSQFAPDAFELEAVDYLIKPIPFGRFLKAIQKVENRLNTYEGKSQQPYLFIKSDYKTLRVDFDEILFIEGMKDFISVHTPQQDIPTLLTISGILEKLPAANFIRVHRSFVIALDKISSIERGHIFIGEFKIPIGDMYRDELMKRII